MSPRRAKNSQRRKLSGQSLIAQVNAEPVLFTQPPSGGYDITLSVPVHGDATGLTAGFFDDAFALQVVPATIVDPQKIHFDTAAFIVIGAWVENPAGLRTAQNGTIVPRPLAQT